MIVVSMVLELLIKNIEVPKKRDGIYYESGIVTADSGSSWKSAGSIPWKVSRFRLLRSLKLGIVGQQITKHRLPPLPSSPRLLHRRPLPLSPSCCRSLHLPQRCLLLGRQILLIRKQRQRLVRSWFFLGSSSSLGKLHHTPSSVVLAIPSGTVSSS